MRLSILDQSPIATGKSKAEALRETIALARAAEEEGYHRFWLAEHHDSPGFAGTTPSLMALAVLEATTMITVGSGGVLLGLHEPWQVAEAFEILAALHPGRVNLGVGRAGSGGTGTFNEKVIELQARLGLVPGTREREDLDIWLLGAGTGSAPLAAATGSGYAHAHFLNTGSARTALAHYRKNFQAGTVRREPETLLAVRVIAATTDAQAHELANPVRLWRARKDLGRDEPFPVSTNPANWSSEEIRRSENTEARLIVGAADDIALQLSDLADELDVEELMISTPVPRLVDRINSNRLLARAVARLFPADESAIAGKDKPKNASPRFSHS
ncbi:luciferase family oxidoreductase group 1 [Arthrobacter stackebrandtii]|uniref:Luciferase family oxidoreductase group 1 n=1 Tax=Arthrobacter stackebrandtii TaxID=272161 RepID=A0ABS4YUQ4_9MICC|nr:MsnO8 family LLM class oxidoreductase [Arthrobacter stackebrandtii]MBP2412454.1 luciferase family oxidoreductase group 1 [Arthrobacter stackebrandtii]PYH02214.1 LLM class flavin-dependent oxidoreductase [Arthrobacter stackebrandtii]